MAYEPSASTPGESSGLSDRASQVSSEAKARASELGRKTTEKVDHARAAAGGLDSIASAVHERADGLPGGERVEGLAHSAADALTSTADYVREHNVRDMMEDVLEVVKKNPGAALLGAAALGFLVGRTLWRN